MKILYIMNVDWKWIKQRPHFIAEGLAKNNNVTLYYPCSYQRNKTMFCENSTTIIKPHKYYNLPFRGRSNILYKLNSAYLWILFYIIRILEKPDVLWVGGNPNVVEFLPSKDLKKVVYDCMDDYYAMSNSKKMLENERKIVSGCRHILASSISLKEKLVERYGVEDKKITLIRNAYDGKIIEKFVKKEFEDIFKIAYIGTVSSWFDFDLIEYAVQKLVNIQFHIVGPVKPEVVEKCKMLEGGNVVFHGSMEHDSLYGFISDIDCLIMPFVINDIILSVDPVKLYEYINFNKNIISVKYSEIDRFSDFVNFYSTKEEAIEVIRTLQRNRKLTYTNEERIDFLSANDWSSRMECIEEVLKDNY